MTGNQQDLLHQAVALHQAQKLEAAEQLYRQILETDPDHTAALQLLGTLHERRGNVREGITLMERSLALDPRQPHVLLNLGSAYAAIGEAELALEHHHRAVAL